MSPETKPDPIRELVAQLAVTAAPPSPRPRGKPWTVGEFASHFSVTPKHTRFLLDTKRVRAILIGKRKRLVPDDEVRRLEKEGIA